MIMRREIWFPIMGCMLLLACKPTPRTATEKSKSDPPAEQVATPETGDTKPGQADTPQPQAETAVGLLYVGSTRQDFNRIRPWEKKNTNTGHFMGVYLGGGRVLTVGKAARAATYVELSLPDHTRTVPARVLKYDEDLNLALLTVEHEQDASIFDHMPEHALGEPLSIGGKAELWTMINGVIPMHVAVEVESADEEGGMPRLNLRSLKPLPSGMSDGLPVLQEGRLVALVDDYDTSEQALQCVNAELIRRFMEEKPESELGAPILGISCTHLDDPVFSKYLKLNPEQGGIYVSELQPAGAAAQAGIRKGDVVVAIENLPLDKLGRCEHPLYGLLDAAVVIRCLKPMGESISLTISRDGKEQTISVPLNRNAVEKSLFPPEKPGVPPRYIMWGGLLFQPLTDTYLTELRKQSNSLPLPFLEAQDQEEKLAAEGRHELVALTLVIPTPATLGYDALGFCVVEKVNGTPVTSFAQFAELLDAPTADGIITLTINRPPYNIYLDRQAVESSNDAIRRRAIPRLRQMGESSAEH